MRTKRTVVVLVSGYAGAGKTTFAELLEKKLLDVPGITVTRYSFANPIKYIAYAFFGWNQEKDDAGRKLLQDIGRIGREYNENVWVTHFFEQLSKRALLPFNFVIVDDWRFPNEANTIEKNPLTTVFKVRVTGRDTNLTGDRANDVSEVSLPEKDPTYWVVDNSGNIDDLDISASVLTEKLEEIYIIE